MKKSRPEIKAKEATKAREATSSTVEIHEEEVETVKRKKNSHRRWKWKSEKVIKTKLGLLREDQNLLKSQEEIKEP